MRKSTKKNSFSPAGLLVKMEIWNLVSFNLTNNFIQVSVLKAEDSFIRHCSRNGSEHTDMQINLQVLNG
jgi:hypothetical protein